MLCNPYTNSTNVLVCILDSLNAIFCFLVLQSFRIIMRYTCEQSDPKYKRHCMHVDSIE